MMAVVEKGLVAAELLAIERINADWGFRLMDVNIPLMR